MDYIYPSSNLPSSGESVNVLLWMGADFSFFKKLPFPGTHDQMSSFFRLSISFFSLAVLPLFAIPGDSQSLEETLISAVEKGDVAETRRLLDKGADPNARRPEKTVDMPETTALRAAINGDHVEIMDALLEKEPSNDSLIDAMVWCFGGFPPTGRPIQRLFVERLLAQGKADFLVKNSRYIRSENALQALLKEKPVTDPRNLLNSLTYHSFETVRLIVDRVPDILVLLERPLQDPLLGSSDLERMPLYFVNRAGERVHEEPLIAKLVSDMTARGLPPEAWGEFAPIAAKKAHEYGFSLLATAMGSKDDQPPPRGFLTDEDRLASAFFLENLDAVALLRNNGVQLRGRSIVESSLHGRITLTQKWISEKAFDQFERHQIDPGDGTTPEHNPFRAATDLESIQWLIGRGVTAANDHDLLAMILRRELPDKIQVIRALVAAGAPLRPAVEGVPSKLMGTIVVFDISGDRIAIAKTLMELGADPTLKDPGGKSAIQWAEQTFQLEMLAVLDPKRESALWKKYGGNKRSEHLAGAWSNGLDEFKTVTLLLMKNGTATLFSAVGAADCVWYSDADGKVFLEVIQGNPPYEREITATGRLIHSGVPSESLSLEYDGARQTLKKTANWEEIEKAVEAAKAKQ